MTALASPLSLILERALANDQIEHALFCTFTFDAGYFERVALGPLDGVGAQVTVVADAAMAKLDPYAARRIGSRYGLGLVHHGGAFHPKVAVLLGRDTCTVAIGSGNVTMAGWHANEELWTSVESDADDWSPFTSAVGRWLQGLSDSAQVGPRVASHLASIGRRLDRPPTGSTIDTPSALGNLQQPIIEQLPTGPVDELNVYAPFHGHGADAIRSLCERLEPELLRVGYQPGSTMLNPGAVGKYLESLAVSVELRALDPARYRHGKLIEWRSGGSWWAVTGSPNLSRAALLLTPSQGGNFELAALTNQTRSLFPPAWEFAEQGSFEALSPPSFEPPHPAASRQILEAVLDGDALVLTLSGPAAEDMAVQVAPSGRPPEQWLPWGIVGTGIETAELDPLPGGSWVQIVGRDGIPSRAVPVQGPAAFRRRTGVGGSSGRSMPDIAELFDDADAASRFLHHLGAVQEKLAADRPASPASEGGGSQPGSGIGHSTWEEYLDRMSGHLGASLLSFSLGMSPRTDTSAGGTDWDDEDIDDAEAGLEDDTVEAMASMAETSVQIPDGAALKDVARAQVMKQLKRLAQPGVITEPTLRLLAVRMTLSYIAGGAWPSLDKTWIDLLLDHAQALVDNPSDQAPIRRRQAAMATLSLNVARSRVSPIPPSLLSLKVDRISRCLKPMVNDLDQGDVDAYCRDIGERLGFNAQPDGVLTFALDLVDSDPLQDAVRKLAESSDGISAHATGRVLVLPPVERATARYLAYACLVILDVAGDVAVQIGAGEPAETWVWHAPHLVRIFVNPKGPVASVWRFNAGSSPRNAGSPDGYPTSEYVMGSSADWAVVDEALAAISLSRHRHYVD